MQAPRVHFMRHPAASAPPLCVPLLLFGLLIRLRGISLIASKGFDRTAVAEGDNIIALSDHHL